MADRGLNGNSSLAYLGVRPTTPPQLVIHPRAPGVHDYISFCIGDIWIDSSGKLLTPPVQPQAGDIYMLTSVAGNVATWIPFIGNLDTLTGDTGFAVPGDAARNIDLNSGIINLSFDGNPGAHQIVLNSAGHGPLAESFTTDDANIVVPNLVGDVRVTGAGGAVTSGAIPHTITITTADVGAHTFPTDNGNAVEIAGVLNILAQTAALGCGSSVSFSAPGATNLVQLNVSDALTNTIIGNLAGNAGITGQHNTVLGVGAAAGLTTSSNNTIIGYHAAQGLTTGTPNIVIGATAGSNMTGAEINNILIGSPGVAATSRFVAIGIGGHTFFHNYPGTIAGPMNYQNNFIGQRCGNFTLTGTGANFGNNGIGDTCLEDLTTGYNNDAHGADALGVLTTGIGNVAFGHNCGYNTGTGLGLTTGSYNLLIGYEAGTNYTGAESSNILIGALTGVVGESNVTKIQNIRGVTTNVADAVAVLIDSAHQLGTVSSSIRYKDNIEDMGADSDNILNLRPVTFEYKKHPGLKQYGLIAEEVVEHMPRLVVFDQDGLPETVKYHELPAILLNEIQKLVKRIDQLEKNLQRYEEL